MKRIVLVMAIAAMLVPAAFAQDDDWNRGSVGVFFDYTRLKHSDLNMYGVGGRVGFNVHPNAQIKFEGAFDFEKNYSASVFDPLSGNTTTVNSNLRLAHLLAGPKFQTTGPVRAFASFKGGILNFNSCVGNVDDATEDLKCSVTNIADGDTNGVFYPSGGIEAYAGWFGVRIEAGDLIYFDRGANHNFRLTVGPQFRF
jgi:opacity protein-like surface antigen